MSRLKNRIKFDCVDMLTLLGRNDRITVCFVNLPFCTRYPFSRNHTADTETKGAVLHEWHSARSAACLHMPIRLDRRSDA